MIAGCPAGIEKLVIYISKPEPRQTTATSEERAALLSRAALDLRFLLLVCSDMCLRSGTALRLAPIHYNRDSDTITIISKAQSVVSLPVTDEIRTLMNLCTHAPSDSKVPYVKLLAGARGVSYSRIHQRYMNLRKECGITKQLTFHDLRRTTARRVLQITGDLRLVQALLGHRNLASTFHYVQGEKAEVEVSILEAAKSNAF